MRIFALVITALITVTACQTTENIGTGPISNMPGKTINGYRNYLRVMEENSQRNMAFAYNMTTRGYAWSAQPQKKGPGYAIDQALELCSKGATRGDCKIFDIDGRIVWTGLDSRLYSQLRQPLPEVFDNRTYKYDPTIYRVSAAQLKLFKSTSEIRKDHNYSAFFISADRKSIGKSYVNSISTTGHAASINSARKQCQIASPK